MERSDDGILPGNVYKLLLKNVSRNDPLTSDEIQELKEFRSTLTVEQWKGWLQFAREEKHELKKQKKRNSPPKLKSLVKDPVVLLEALAKVDGASTDSVESRDSAYRRRHEVSWSDYSASHELIDERGSETEHRVKQGSVGAVQRIGLESAEAAATVPETTAADDIKAEERVEPLIETSAVHQELHGEHHNRASNTLRNQLRQEQQPLRYQRQQEQQQQLETDQQSQLFPTTGHSLEQVYSHHADQQIRQPVHHSSSLDYLGVSLERNQVLGRGARPRSASAPRARSSPGIAGRVPRWELGHNRPPPALPTGNSSGVHTHSPKVKSTATNLFADQPKVSDSFHRAGRRTGNAALEEGVSTSSPRPPGQQTTEQRHLANEANQLSAAEIAHSSALRLESAYSAANYLLSTMTADGYASIPARHCAGQEEDKLPLSVSILTEMMNSMNKSRIALSRLTAAGADGLPSAETGETGSRLPGSAASSASSVSATDVGQIGHLRDINAPTTGGARLQSQHFSLAREPTLAQHWPRGEGSLSAAQLPVRHEEHSAAEECSFVASNGMDDLDYPAWQRSFVGEDIGGSETPRATTAAHSHFAQTTSPGDFSVFNRQVASAAVDDMGGRADPANELQARLFAAVDAARRSSDASVAIARSPGVPRVQYSYNSGGYVWEGTRYARAQGPVVRVCIAHGPLLKAFDDYPVRVDTEAHAVDVVWREARIGEAAAQVWGTSPFASPASGNRGSLTKDRGSTSRNTVLRRERFSFDDIFHGPTADGRLAMYSRQRTRKALEAGRNLAFLCLGCGDVPPGGESAVEPPVSMLLGGSGGTGLISSVVDEIFRFIRPLSVSMHESGKTFPGSFPTKADSPFVASKLAFEQLRSKVTLSAVILSDRGEIFDLLAPAGPHQEVSATASLKRRKSDGRAVLCNASRLQLQGTSDFDRVMGLLLGKRSALQSVLAAFHQQRAHLRDISLSSAATEPLRGIVASIDPWAAFNSRSAERSTETAACASTMLITVSVSGGAATSGQTSADFHFVSPCGKNWFNPGSDVNMLAELVSALPNAPPPSLLRASPLGLLLVDPKKQASDFVNVVVINRESPGNHQGRKTTQDVVDGALNSLRIIAQLVQ